MEKKQSGAILMVVGGALMVVGSFLTWLTAKIDLVAFADAIKKETGVDIGGLPGFSSTPNSSSIAGTKGWEGKLALIGGSSFSPLASRRSWGRSRGHALRGSRSSAAP